MSLIILLSLERVTYNSTYSLLPSELSLEYLVAAAERLTSTLRVDKGDYVIRFFVSFLKLLIFSFEAKELKHLAIMTFLGFSKVTKHYENNLNLSLASSKL